MPIDPELLRRVSDEIQTGLLSGAPYATPDELAHVIIPLVAEAMVKRLRDEQDAWASGALEARKKPRQRCALETLFETIDIVREMGGLE